MKKRIWIALSLLLVLALTGCKKSESEPQSEPEKTAEVAKPVEPDPPKAEPARDTSLPETEVTDGIPTEEDYEEEAEKVITADNLEAELDKLEAEIAN
jgi:ABC-type oligopeptide transport system substrate-binding subunit